VPTKPDWSAERQLWKQGYVQVAGIDEVGRGPLAGPVMAAAVVFAPTFRVQNLPDLNDSKKLSPLARERLSPRIHRFAQGVGIGRAEHYEIDALGIVEATKTAMTRAIRQLENQVDHILVDALTLSCDGLPCRAIIHGDALCSSIAAASIVAKVARDHLMQEMDIIYPGYGFAQHKGYPTEAHIAALEQLGPTPIHRRSFAPVRRIIEGSHA
jgi:ribonuclease HII